MRTSVLMAQGTDTQTFHEVELFGINLPIGTEFNTGYIEYESRVLRSNHLFIIPPQKKFSIRGIEFKESPNQQRLIASFNLHEKKFLQYTLTKKEDGKFVSCSYMPKSIKKKECHHDIFRVIPKVFLDLLLKKYKLGEGSFESNVNQISDILQTPEDGVLIAKNDFTFNGNPVGKGSIFRFETDDQNRYLTVNYVNEYDLEGVKLTNAILKYKITLSTDYDNLDFQLVTLNGNLSQEIVLAKSQFQIGTRVEFKESRISFFADNFYQINPIYTDLKQHKALSCKISVHINSSDLNGSKINEELNNKINRKGGIHCSEFIVMNDTNLFGIDLHNGDTIAWINSSIFLTPKNKISLLGYSDIRHIQFKNTQKISLKDVERIEIDGTFSINNIEYRDYVEIEEGRITKGVLVQPTKIDDFFYIGEYSTSQNHVSDGMLSPQNYRGVQLTGDNKLTRYFENGKAIREVVELNEKVIVDKVVFEPGSALYFDLLTSKFKTKFEQHFSMKENIDDFDFKNIYIPENVFSISKNNDRVVSKVCFNQDFKINNIKFPKNSCTSFETEHSDSPLINITCPKECAFEKFKLKNEIEISIIDGKVYSGTLVNDYKDCKMGQVITFSSDDQNYHQCSNYGEFIWGTMSYYKKIVDQIESKLKFND